MRPLPLVCVWLASLAFCVACWVGVYAAVNAFAAGPITAHGGRACRSSVPCLKRAIRWQKHDRAQLKHQLAGHWRRDATYAIRLASAAFGVSQADMRSVAWCESRMGAQTTPQPGSGASGVFQFLPSTWQHTPYAGFDVFDPLPNALAAAQIVAHDGGWHQWDCKP